MRFLNLFLLLSKQFGLRGSRPRNMYGGGKELLPGNNGGQVSQPRNSHPSFDKVLRNDALIIFNDCLEILQHSFEICYASSDLD